MKTINEALAEYYEQSGGKWRLKQDARAAPGGIPKGSRWFRGCPGDLSCEQCGGNGFVRLEVPVGHPLFGRILLCSCAERMKGK